MSHAEWKLVADGMYVVSEGSGLGSVSADLSNSALPRKEVEDVARRLVACWNEHDGLVHDNAQLYQSLQGEMQGRLKAEKERDELVKALRKVVDWNDKYPSNRVFSHSAIVRIAKERDEISNETRAILARYDEKQQATV